MIRFLTRDEVIRFHHQSILAHGGSPGLRDDGGFESALNAAKNRHYYEDADLVICAATYAYHLTKAHAFIDGNKRVGAIASETFLRLNGARLNISNQELVDLFLDIAANRMNRAEVEAYFRQHTIPS
jgi:death-on-curing protein